MEGQTREEEDGVSARGQGRRHALEGRRLRALARVLAIVRAAQVARGAGQPCGPVAVGAGGPVAALGSACSAPAHAAYPAAQYSTFIASGEHHCRMTDDSIYKTSAKGVNLGGWMGRVVAGNLTDDDARVDCCA